MKKIFLGVMVTFIMSGSAVHAGTGSKEAARKVTKKEARKEVTCSDNCPDTKVCRAGAKCPAKPGCVCN